MLRNNIFYFHFEISLSYKDYYTSFVGSVKAEMILPLAYKLPSIVQLLWIQSWRLRQTNWHLKAGRGTCCRERRRFCCCTQTRQRCEWELSRWETWGRTPQGPPKDGWRCISKAEFLILNQVIFFVNKATCGVTKTRIERRFPKNPITPITEKRIPSTILKSSHKG